MNDFITSVEEHIIALQDEDVKRGTRTHERTIALLRQAVAEIDDLPKVECCDVCGERLDKCSNCQKDRDDDA